MKRPYAALVLATILVTDVRSVRAAPAPMTWLLPRYVLASFGNDPVAKATFLSDARTFLIVRPDAGAQAPIGRTTPTVSYRSYADLRAAFADGSAPKTGAILYDNEKWSFTPDGEKADPKRFERLAAALVHAHGLTFISTPAIALSGALDPGTGTVADKYVRLGMAGDAARYADVVDIQAQSLQYDAHAYAMLVAAAARQARAANPRVIVVAGLTTGRNHPDGSPPTSDDLVQAVRATRSLVDGYWLNVPAPGVDCPQCAALRPDIALDFLHRLAADR